MMTEQTKPDTTVTLTDYQCDIITNVFDHLLRFTDENGNVQIDLSPDDVAQMHSVIALISSANAARWDTDH